MESITGLENAKGALKESAIFPMKFPQLFQGRRNYGKLDFYVDLQEHGKAL